MKKTLYKYLINWRLAGDKPLPQWLERACERDPELAAERDAGDGLTRALRERPQDPLPPLGESMASRVLCQITEEDYLETPHDAKSGFAWASALRSAGLVAAALGMVAVGYQFFRQASNGGVDSQAPGAVALVDSVEAGASDAAEILQLGKNLKNPLDQEIEYVLSDARGALDFLTSSFVPSSLLKKDEARDEGNNA